MTLTYRSEYAERAGREPRAEGAAACRSGWPSIAIGCRLSGGGDEYRLLPHCTERTMAARRVS